MVKLNIFLDDLQLYFFQLVQLSNSIGHDNAANNIEDLNHNGLSILRVNRLNWKHIDKACLMHASNVVIRLSIGSQENIRLHYTSRISNVGIWGRKSLPTKKHMKTKSSTRRSKSTSNGGLTMTISYSKYSRNVHMCRNCTRRFMTRQHQKISD
jgi:hypothetical protein